MLTFETSRINNVHFKLQEPIILINKNLRTNNIIIGQRRPRLVISLPTYPLSIFRVLCSLEPIVHYLKCTKKNKKNLSGKFI